MSLPQIDFLLYREPSSLFRLMQQLGLLGNTDLNRFIYNDNSTIIQPNNITFITFNITDINLLVDENSDLNDIIKHLMNKSIHINLLLDLSSKEFSGSQDDYADLLTIYHLFQKNEIDCKRIALLFGNPEAAINYANSTASSLNQIPQFTVLGYNYKQYVLYSAQSAAEVQQAIINNIFNILGTFDHAIPMREFTHFNVLNMNVKDWPPPRIKPLVYFIELSSLCNAACIFCHYPQLRDKGKPTTIADDIMVEKTCSLVEADVMQRNLHDIGISITPTTGDILINKNWAIIADEFLKKPYIAWADIVTNGILLNEKNIDALCKLSNLHKLNFSVSVGGADRETYKFMFGTDMFNKVLKNINLLFEKLKQNDIKLFTTIRLRVPDKQKLSKEQIASLFNPCGYVWAVYEILDTFKDVPEDVPGKQHLKTTSDLTPRDNNPCGMLKIGAMNFGAEGNITACGCHYSQMPNETSLVLGNINSSLSDLMANRQKLIYNWKVNNTIPIPCRSCQHYHQHSHIENQNVLLPEKSITTVNKQTDNFSKFDFYAVIFNCIEIGSSYFYQLKHENYNGYFRLLKDYYGLKSPANLLNTREYYVIQGDINSLGDEERLLGKYEIDKVGIKEIIIDVSFEAINLQLSNQFYVVQLKRLASILSQTKYQYYKFYLLQSNTSHICLSQQLKQYNIYFNNLEFITIDFYLHRFNLDIRKLLSLDGYKHYLNNGIIKDKHFICLNHRPRWHRYAIMLSLLANNHLDKVNSSFAGEQQGRICADTIDEHAYMQQQVEKLHCGGELLNQLNKLHSISPIVLDKSPATIQEELWGKEGTGHLGQPLGLHKNNTDIDNNFLSSYLEIVTETYFTDEHCSYITEKTLRPIFAMRPFICVGTPFTLKKLKAYGFKTFSPFINEGYDNIQDPIVRMNAILIEINRLCSMPLSQIEEIYTKLQAVLLYNHEHYLENFHNLMHDYLDVTQPLSNRTLVGESAL